MYIKVIALVAAAIIASGCAKEQPIVAHAASGEFFAAATIGTLGGFDSETAPVYTRLIITRHKAEVALREHEMTRDDAINVQATADNVRSLLDASLVACGQDDKTGKCMKDDALAHRLLGEASSKLASI